MGEIRISIPSENLKPGISLSGVQEKSLYAGGGTTDPCYCTLCDINFCFLDMTQQCTYISSEKQM